MLVLSKTPIPSVVLAPMLLVMQPEMILVFFAASHCWLMAILASVPILGGLLVG